MGLSVASMAAKFSSVCADTEKGKGAEAPRRPLPPPPPAKSPPPPPLAKSKAPAVSMHSLQQEETSAGAASQLAAPRPDATSTSRPSRPPPPPPRPPTSPPPPPPPQATQPQSQHEQQHEQPEEEEEEGQQQPLQQQQGEGDSSKEHEIASSAGVDVLPVIDEVPSIPSSPPLSRETSDIKEAREALKKAGSMKHETETGKGFVHHRSSVVLAHELQKVSSAPHTVAEHLPAARKGLVAPVLRFLEKKLADQGVSASDVQRPTPQVRQAPAQPAPQVLQAPAQPAQELNLIRGPTGGVGLGISRAARSGPFVVRQLVPGSAVEQSNRMQMGDHLHEVSGVSVHDKGLDQVKALILGQPGTLLSLKYYSPTPEERAKIMAIENGEAACVSAGAQRPAPQAAQAQEAPSPDRKVLPRRRSWIMGPHQAGIGLTLTEPELRVVDVVAGGAAHAIAGFAEVGDVLVSVDGVNVAGMSLAELGKLIVGDEGTVVAITLAKGGTGEHKSAALSRRTPRNSMSKYSIPDA